MKKFYFLLMMSCFILISCVKTQFNFSQYFESNIGDKKHQGTVVAKVNDTPLYHQDVREEMKYQLSLDYSTESVDQMMADQNIQKSYQNKIINQYLVINKLLNDKTFDSEEFQDYMWVNMKELVVKYYLYEKFFENKENDQWKKLLVTPDYEVLAFYNENQDFFNQRNVSRADALTAIRSDMERRKSQLFLAELTQFQTKLLEEIKTEIKLERFEN